MDLSTTGSTVNEYIPPHPFEGSRYHRYPLFVLEQRDGLETKLADYDATNFNTRKFCADSNLSPIGAYMWRCEFDEHTEKIMSKLGVKPRQFTPITQLKKFDPRLQD